MGDTLGGYPALEPVRRLRMKPQAFGGTADTARIEGGRRFILVDKFSAAPFVAVQAQTAHTDAYTERLTGGW